MIPSACRGVRVVRCDCLARECVSFQSVVPGSPPIRKLLEIPGSAWIGDSPATFNYDVSMKPESWLPTVLLCMSTMLGAQHASSDHAEFHATFTASNGDVIKLDTRTRTLDTPHSRGARLQDCSDKSQVCLTDHHGFAFAYFRKCNDAGNYKSLRFPPKVVSVLQNNVWLVFDASPNYLFHYDFSKGIVGIYIGPTVSFDFRSALHDRKFNLFSLDATEYRITGSDTVAACVQ